MDYKILLPIENYTLTSRLSTEEVINRIAENVGPKKTFSLSFFDYGSTKPYTGEIAGSTFEISRAIRYRNSFLPLITGQISNYFGQTLIKIKMRLSPIVIAFMCLWLMFFIPMCLSFITNGIFNFKNITGNNFSYDKLFPFGMFLFGWLIMLISFKVESRKSKKFLATLLEGEEAEDYQTKMIG